MCVNVRIYMSSASILTLYLQIYDLIFHHTSIPMSDQNKKKIFYMYIDPSVFT